MKKLKPSFIFFGDNHCEWFRSDTASSKNKSDRTAWKINKLIDWISFMLVKNVVFFTYSRHQTMKCYRQIQYTLCEWERQFMRSFNNWRDHCYSEWILLNLNNWTTFLVNYSFFLQFLYTMSKLTLLQKHVDFCNNFIVLPLVTWIIPFPKRGSFYASNQVLCHILTILFFGLIGTFTNSVLYLSCFNFNKDPWTWIDSLIPKVLKRNKKNMKKT